MADTRKMSITQALRELKLLDAKIYRNVQSSDQKYIAIAKKSSDCVGTSNIKRETFVNNAKADYQSVCDLIENRKRIKEAIVQSNASTVVEIGGEKYTVAQAIERKNSIQYEKDLLNHLRQEYDYANTNVTSANARVDMQIDKMLEAYIGKDGDKKITEADLEVITKPYRQKNEWELVDPLGLLDKIEKLAKDIEDFESNVDVCLSMINATTFIEI